MKIWLRIPQSNLTHARTAMGMSISYDGVADAFNRMGIECLKEFPTGNHDDTEQHVPPDPGGWMVMWYCDPMLWDLDDKTPNRGLVCYSRCGECIMPGYEQMARCDMAFVASSSGQQFHLNNSGSFFVGTPLGIISGGVDPIKFPYSPPDFHCNPFTFLSVGVTHERKGNDVACEAFCMAFGESEDVKLKVISPGETEMFMELKDRYASDQRIDVACKLVLDRSMVQTEYYNGHCLLYLSYIEGWGRCLPEAMLTGIPSIVTRQSSMLDQFSADCGWWVKGTLSGGIDIDEIAQRMRCAYLNRDDCKEKGLFARRFALNNLTWESGIGKALPALNAIYKTKELGIEHLSDCPQLNIGCNKFPLDGWLNLDIEARAIRATFADSGEVAPEIYRFDLRESFNLPDNSVDAITISHVLVTIEEQHIVRCLNECYRVLKGGGVARFTEDDDDHFYFPSTTYFTPAKMREMVGQAGFRAEIMDRHATNYSNSSICVDFHGDPPKCFFVEGVK